MKTKDMDCALVTSGHKIYGTEFVECTPLWECELTSEQLRKRATKLAIETAAEHGTGPVTVEIYDFRETAETAE